MALSPAERQARRRTRKHQGGLVKLEAWVSQEETEALDAEARRLLTTKGDLVRQIIRDHLNHAP